LYNFKDANTVRISKFENSKKIEEVEMKLSALKYISMELIITTIIEL